MATRPYNTGGSEVLSVVTDDKPPVSVIRMVHARYGSRYLPGASFSTTLSLNNTSQKADFLLTYRQCNARLSDVTETLLRRIGLEMLPRGTAKHARNGLD